MGVVLRLFSYLKWWIIYRSESYKIFDKKRDKYFTKNERNGIFRLFRERDINNGKAKLVKGVVEKRKALAMQKRS